LIQTWSKEQGKNKICGWVVQRSVGVAARLNYCPSIKI
jgi:hypothetical protein